MYSALVSRMVGGCVDTVRKEDHGFASLDTVEVFLHELVDRIIKMCAKTSAGAFNPFADSLTVACRLGLNFCSHAEGYDPNLIVWSQLIDEGLRCVLNLAKSRPGGTSKQDRKIRVLSLEYIQDSFGQCYYIRSALN